MKIKDIPFQEIPQFSKFDKAYVEEHTSFKDFYNRPPIDDSFVEQINEKKNNFNHNREDITQTIEYQYDKVGLLNDNIKNKIANLHRDRTFTIITAHQPSLFTGPLYFIYKIISAIRTADLLDSKIEDYSIVPLFVIGGEDHDFAEINHIQYKDHRFEWEEEHGGAVGRMSTSKIRNVIDDLKPQLNKTFYGKEILALLEEAYNGERNLGEATHYLIAKLFAETSLLVLSMDDKRLKQAFVPLIKNEILNEYSHSFVEETQSHLADQGFEPQAHARNINFFYLSNGLRSRIVKKEDKYQILDSEQVFSKDEMISEIERHPERFSPNVIMRPIYQEYILPNLAYIGGGGELAYWMERKDQFEHFQVCFPILIRRHSATLINSNTAGKMDSFDWTHKDWFKTKDQLIDQFLSNQHENETNFSPYYTQLHKLFDELRQHMAQIDETLDYSAEAGRSDALAVIERLQTKVKRALKKKEEIQLARIDAVQKDILPEGNLQERTHNFIQYYEQWGPALFDMISEAFTPFDIQMKMIIDP